MPPDEKFKAGLNSWAGGGAVPNSLEGASAVPYSAKCPFIPGFIFMPQKPGGRSHSFCLADEEMVFRRLRNFSKVKSIARLKFKPVSQRYKEQNNPVRGSFQGPKGQFPGVREHPWKVLRWRKVFEHRLPSRWARSDLLSSRVGWGGKNWNLEWTC